MSVTWRELNDRVEAAGLADERLEVLHVLIDGPDADEDEANIEIFKNANGTLSVVNSCCR